MRRMVPALLSVIGLVVLIGIVGCLKVPLGDPEKSKVDQSLSGCWLLKDARPDENQLVTIVPYDARTSLLTYLTFARDERNAITPRGQLTYRMWTTRVKDATFATLEPKAPALLLDDSEKRYPVMRLTREGDRIDVRILSETFVSTNDVKTPEELEKLVAANLNEADLYDGEATFERLGEARAEEARAILDAFHMSK